MYKGVGAGGGGGVGLNSVTHTLGLFTQSQSARLK